MAIRRHRSIVRPTRRQMVWFQAGLANTVISSTSTTLLTVLNAAGLALRPFTIIRTRLVISFATDQLAASESPQGVFTMGVVSEQASAAGVASVPSGIAEPDGDFFVYQGLQANVSFGDATGFASLLSHYVIDSKAQRKVGINEDVVQVIETRSGGGADLSIEGRYLVKLH